MGKAVGDREAQARVCGAGAYKCTEKKEEEEAGWEGGPVSGA